MLPSIVSLLTTLLAAALPGNVPSPALAPADVVRAQLAAMAANDPARGDRGIRRTFLFASPQNKLVTGPADRFVEVVNDPAYAPLLNARRSTIREERREGDTYAALVEVVGRDGRSRLFAFQVGLQPDGPMKGCWMTEGVSPLEPAPPPAEGPGII